MGVTVASSRRSDRGSMQVVRRFRAFNSYEGQLSRIRLLSLPFTPSQGLQPLRPAPFRIPLAAIP